MFTTKRKWRQSRTLQNACNWWCTNWMMSFNSNVTGAGVCHTQILNAWHKWQNGAIYLENEIHSDLNIILPMRIHDNFIWMFGMIIASKFDLQGPGLKVQVTVAISSSPEHKVLMVSYCDRSSPVSVVSRASCVINNRFKWHLLWNRQANFDKLHINNPWMVLYQNSSNEVDPCKPLAAMATKSKNFKDHLLLN